MATSQAINTLYAGGSFTTVEGDVNIHTSAKSAKALKLLHRQIAPGAFHNSAERFDAPKCHPQTRTAILQEIQEWTENDSHAYPFLWMYGPAGTGKSSIAQSIAEMLFRNGKIGASFFFSRTVAGRNTDTHLIATIAYQLSIALPQMSEYIATALDNDPFMFSRSLQAQFDALVVQPLAQLSEQGAVEGQLAETRRVVIIDGLDECGDGKSQHQVLSALFTAVQNSPSMQLCFLIASRPEHEIRTIFNDNSVSFLTRRLILDDKYKPDEDIRLFLQSKFDHIKQNHPLGPNLPPTWPSTSDLERLVQKASGQFIYVSTVLKFVESPRHWPTDRLNIVLGLISPGNNTPFEGLDALYRHIFASALDIQRVMVAFSFLIFNESATNTDMDTIEDFLQFRRGELRLILTDLHSIIYVPASQQPQRLHLFHASLQDFLLDRSRSGRFFIDAGKSHTQLARVCIMHLNNPVNRARFSLTILGLAYDGFVLHCAMSYPTRELHEDLENLDFEEYLKMSDTSGTYRPLFDEQVIRLFPSFFQWIQNQEPNLSRKYTEHFDSYLMSQLAQYPNATASSHLFTASTLSSFPKYCSFIFQLLKQQGYGDLYRTDGSAVGLRFAGAEPEEGGYFRMVAEFLTDVKRSGIYHVNGLAYMHLSKVLVDALGNNPRTTIVQVEHFLDCLLETLSLCPVDMQVAQYLQDNPILQGVKHRIEKKKKEKALLVIQVYIENAFKDTPGKLENLTSLPMVIKATEADEDLYSYVLVPAKRSLKGRIAKWFGRKTWLQ